jgi:hypothetical protein
METVINVDANIRSSDWIKSASWSFSEIQTLKDLISMVAGLDKEESIQKQKILDFMRLPASIPMPDPLRRQVYEFLGESLPNPMLYRRVVWCLKTSDRFFPEDLQKMISVYERIKTNKINFFDDLDFSDQAVILDLETRTIPDKMYPKSYLALELDRAAKLRK